MTCEGKTLTVAVIDDRVLDSDVGTAVSVPSVGVLGWVAALTRSSNVDVVEYNVGGVRYNVVPLRTVPQHEITDGRVVQTNDAHENGAENVDIRRIEVVPDLAIAIDSATTLGSS
jgi:hypothetical protein